MNERMLYVFELSTKKTWLLFRSCETRFFEVILEWHTIGYCSKIVTSSAASSLIGAREHHSYC